MDFVWVGSAGNTADASTGYGAVNYDYRMGRTEVSVEQFSAAQSADPRIGNGNETYWNDGIRTGGLLAPAARVSWLEAALFCNWLTSGDAYAGAYVFSAVGDLTAVDRASAVGVYGTVYVLPTEDEWYKAAYYKPIAVDYSLYAQEVAVQPASGGVDGWNYSVDGVSVNLGPDYVWAVDAGASERSGTVNMMGNVSELLESAWDGTLDDCSEFRVRRGGEYGSDLQELEAGYRLPVGVTGELSNTGFRVAVIPEPSSVALLGVGFGFLLLYRHRSHQVGPFSFSSREGRRVL